MATVSISSSSPVTSLITRPRILRQTRPVGTSGWTAPGGYCGMPGTGAAERSRKRSA